MSTYSLEKIVTCLRDVSDITWGRYAFKSEMLKNKIQTEQTDEMILNAIVCGTGWAQQLRSITDAVSIDSLLKQLGLCLNENDLDMTAMPRQLFAQYIPDKQVEIMTQPINIYSRIYKPPLPEPDLIRSILIAHEMYHHIERLNKSDIYSQTEKICLWNLLGLKWYSTVRTIGEIAAMSFAKSLTNADFNPFMLDVILLYGYNEILAERIFHDIMYIEAG